MLNYVFCFCLKVQYWITHNEPWVISTIVYGPDPEHGAEWCYTSAHNLILAHGKTYQLYKSQYVDSQQG